MSEFEFQEEFATIKNELFAEGKENFIWKKLSLSNIVMDKSWYGEWYENNMVKFPMSTEARQDCFVLSDSFVLGHKFYYYYAQSERTAKQQQDILTETANADIISLKFDLQEAINERINNFIHYFKEGLNLLKNGSYFSHIKDKGIIIKNMLNYYQQVREDKSVQLSFFSSAKLHADVADQMLDMLIAIMKDKLQMMEPNLLMVAQAPRKLLITDTKIRWLGTQQDFAELMLELKEKNYIAFEEESFTGIAGKCAQVFDFSASQRKSSSNVTANLTTYLKPVFNQDSAKTEFFFEKTGYSRKFKGFPVNFSKKP